MPHRKLYSLVKWEGKYIDYKLSVKQPWSFCSEQGFYHLKTYSIWGWLLLCIFGEADIEAAIFVNWMVSCTHLSNHHRVEKVSPCLPHWGGSPSPSAQELKQKLLFLTPPLPLDSTSFPWWGSKTCPVPNICPPGASDSALLLQLIYNTSEKLQLSLYISINHQTGWSYRNPATSARGGCYSCDIITLST